MTNTLKFSRIIPMSLVAACSLAGVVACGGAGAAGTSATPAAAAANPGATPPASGSSGGAANGYFSDQGKTNDPDQLTVALKFVSYSDPAGKPVINEADSKTLLQGMNSIFATCKLRYVIQDYHVEDPSKAGLPFSLSSMDQLDPVRKQYQESDRLVVEFTGAWDHAGIGAGNAWTAMPGSNPPGAVIESIVATDPRIVGHELGHYLGLDHVSDQTNLLSPIVYPNSSNLTADQCSTVRSTATGYWKAALR